MSCPPQPTSYIGCGREADGADFFFIGDVYRRINFPEQAVPLYRVAIVRLTLPAPKIAALRGLAYAEALLESPPAAETAMHEGSHLCQCGGVLPSGRQVPKMRLMLFASRSSSLKLITLVRECPIRA
jgi:hypothetical protein